MTERRRRKPRGGAGAPVVLLARRARASGRPCGLLHNFVEDEIATSAMVKSNETQQKRLLFWQFAVAAILVFGLLIQFALERMSNSIEASRIQAVSDLGWKEQHLSDEEYRTRIEKILGQ